MSKTNGHHADDTFAEDKLIEVPQYSLIKFRNMFKANWPEHITAYYLIENYMEWLEKVNNMKNLKIYSLNGEWRKDGTFVIIVSYCFLKSYKLKRKEISFFKNYLRHIATKLTFFRHRTAIVCLCTRLTSPTRSSSEFWTCWTGAKASTFRLFVNVICQLSYKSLRRSDCQLVTRLCLTSTTCRKKTLLSLTQRELNFHQKIETLLNLFLMASDSSPEGIYLKQLVPEHGEKINELWPHKHNGSLYFIQRLIEMNMNIGAFTKEDDELIAWCLRWVSLFKLK